MSAAENKVIVRRYIEEVVNTGDVARLDEFIAAGFRQQVDPPGHIAGIAGCRDHILAVRMTYPDLLLQIEKQVAEGDLVATRVTMTGTHRGEWPPGVKATNKPVRITAVNFDRVQNGRIVEHGGAANELMALIECGVIHFGPVTK